MPAVAVSLADALTHADRLRDSGQLQQAVALLLSLEDRGQAHVEYQRRLGLLRYMQGEFAEAVEVLTRAIAIAPEDGTSYKFLAGSFSALGDPGRALLAARQAAARLPTDAQIRNALGAMCVEAGLIEEAIGHFQAALGINPNDLHPLSNLEVLAARFGAAGFQKLTPPHIDALRRTVIENLAGQLSQGQLGLAEADLLCTLSSNREAHFTTAEEIERQFGERADLPSGLEIGLAVVCQNRGDLSGALRHFETAARIDPQASIVRNGLGALYVTAGGDRWLEGWRLLSESYRLLNPRNYPGEVPQWTGADLKGGKLFVHFDQGIGDALIGLRFLKFLVGRGIAAVLWLTPSLKEIACFPEQGLELIVSSDRPDPRSLGCTAACGLLELVAPLGLTLDDIDTACQLVMPDPVERSTAAKLDQLTGRKVALIALGNPNRIDDWLRSVKPIELEPLAQLPNISWINLSVDDRPERAELMQRLSMFDAAPLIASFADTARILQNVDEVLAIDCAAAHLAASLGRPLSVFQPTMLDWRWQIADRSSPWWPRATMLKADRPGSWKSAIERLASRLGA